MLVTGRGYDTLQLMNNVFLLNRQSKDRKDNIRFLFATSLPKVYIEMTFNKSHRTTHQMNRASMHSIIKLQGSGEFTMSWQMAFNENITFDFKRGLYSNAL